MAAVSASWRDLIKPDLVLGGTVLDLTPELLHRHRLAGMVLDVDDTLVPMSSSEVTAELGEWLAQTRQLTTLWLVSNNPSSNRIGRIAAALDLPYIHGAGKPSRRKLRQAVGAMNLPPHQVAMVGDRLFTDVLAGNRLGLFTILVEPVVSPTSLLGKHTLRSLEIWLSQAINRPA
ncbi:YqeG family HAD IIIA-type phosphatase [Leptolyngbya sp. FACHB-261]|uniref:YqeG family HAD IIIA-type phosphatase n=1 Tax=Leptolyngbya sp. FACHB-261 TaxID=2692806 RepID=UPI001682071A|nr:YqeG family HAD IIIA-type phosphatase [Leptolyngbya sp. FACHB-261]MBD2099409.1 YqeG family HAD IIIA-type phosphatase [Leptolyngbya sp. FACHB-261]